MSATRPIHFILRSGKLRPENSSILNFDSTGGVFGGLVTRARRLVAGAGSICLLGLACFNPVFAAPPTQGPDLDHFRCYSVTGGHLHLPPFVFLRDQFDELIDPDGTSPLTWIVGWPTGFCPPAAKEIFGPPGPDESTPIEHENHHLTFYQIFTVEPARHPNWNVKVDNQFGRQTLFAGKPTLLGVPTWKISVNDVQTDHERPDELDHFKCYEAKGQSLNIAATLDDQFERTEIIVRDPVLFCNPTVKQFGQDLSRITNEEAHLTCYDIDLAGQIGVASLLDVEIENQFTEVVTFASPFLKVVTDEKMLCVPSLKTGVLSTPGSITAPDRGPDGTPLPPRGP